MPRLATIHVSEVILAGCAAGHDLELHELTERRMAADPAGEVRPPEHPARVASRRKEVAIDLGLLVRVAGLEPQ